MAIVIMQTLKGIQVLWPQHFSHSTQTLQGLSAAAKKWELKYSRNLALLDNLDI